MKGIRLQVMWSPLIVLTVTLSLILPTTPATPVLAHEAAGALEPRDSVTVTTGPSAASEQDRTRIQTALGQLPLYFIENRGQVDRQVAYYAQGSDVAIYFTPDGVTFTLTSPRPSPAPLAEKEQARGSHVRRHLATDAGAATPQAGATQRWAVKLDFLDANPNVKLAGEGKTEAVVSYLLQGPT